MNQPTLSLLFPLYKSRRYLDNLTTHLDRFKDSETEVIVSDRHCHDDAIDVLRQRYQDGANFRFLSATDGVGWVGHFNALIEAASGKYFSLVYHDDLYPADYFDVLVDELERRPSALVAFGHMHTAGENTWAVDHSIFRERFEYPYSTQQYIRLLYSNVLGVPCRGVFRAAPIKKERLFFRSSDRVSMFEDYYWIFALLLRGDFVFSERTSCVKVFHKMGASGQWDYDRYFFKTNAAARRMLYGYTMSSELPLRVKAGICAGIEARSLAQPVIRSALETKAAAGRFLRAIGVR